MVIEFTNGISLPQPRRVNPVSISYRCEDAAGELKSELPTLEAKRVEPNTVTIMIYEERD